MKLVSIKLEGGPENGILCGAPVNVKTIWRGHRGSEIRYNKTERKDANGRIIFKAD